MILRLQHIGTAHKSHASAAERLRQVGLEPAELRTDQGRGFQLDSRKLLGNECWLHVVHNWNPEARVCQYLRTIGEGLEHIAIETDDIEGAVARVRESAPIFEDRIFHAADGFEAFVYPDDGCGFTVELIQPHASSWNWPDPPPACVSPLLSVTHLAEVVAGAADPEAAGRRFEELFDVGFEMDGGSARVPSGTAACSVSSGINPDSGAWCSKPRTSTRTAGRWSRRGLRSRPHRRTAGGSCGYRPGSRASRSSCGARIRPEPESESIRLNFM